MGSFNETCALSGLPITPGDKVKLVFLSESVFSDKNKRGCYINDNYVLRTPPIDGEYDDYGLCAFDDKQPVVDLIVKNFHRDLIQQPFGFNQYHDLPTPANATIDQILECAWKGRLFVQDNIGTLEDREPESFPTWRRVRDKLVVKKKKIQLNQDDKAYNVQPIRRGIVCVHFNTYDNDFNKKKLESVNKFLSKDYETKLVREGEDRGDYALLVMPKGVLAFMLLDNESTKLHWDMNNFPIKRFEYNNQKVFSVMIRQDVWDLYLKSSFDITWQDLDYTIEGFISRLQDYAKKLSEEPKLFTEEEIAKMSVEELKEYFTSMKRMMFLSTESDLRDIFQNATGATGLCKHFTEIFTGEYTEEQIQDLIRIFAEAAKVEFIKMAISSAWFLPITSGQEDAWETHKEIHSGLVEIAANAIKKYKEEDEDE